MTSPLRHPLTLLRLSAAFWGVLAVTGCMTMPESGESARVRMNLNVERLTAADAPLKAMVITFTSSRGDTLRDTITDQGARIAGAHVVLNPPADQGQVIMPRYDLPHGRGFWTCFIESVDARDTIIHQSGCEVGEIGPGEVRDIALRLAARVASYEAVFHPRPATPAGARIALARFELDVDGMTQCTAALEDAATDAPVKIGCAYLTAGPREVVTRVYGRVGDDATERLLWSGRKPVDIKAGSGRAEPLTLTWEAAPELGKRGAAGAKDASPVFAEMNTELRLGRVGQVVFNVVIPTAVVL